MSELNINGKAWNFEGKPLMAFVLDEGGWAGRTNFYSFGDDAPSVQLRDLKECLSYMREWTAYPDYHGGFVLDFETRIVYYDNETAFEHVRTKIEKQGWGGYFEKFIQRNFTEPNP